VASLGHHSKAPRLFITTLNPSTLTQLSEATTQRWQLDKPAEVLDFSSCRQQNNFYSLETSFLYGKRVFCTAAINSGITSDT
jgi:hypothetical protein